MATTDTEFLSSEDLLKKLNDPNTPASYWAKFDTDNTSARTDQDVVRSINSEDSPILKEPDQGPMKDFMQGYLEMADLTGKAWDGGRRTVIKGDRMYAEAISGGKNYDEVAANTDGNELERLNDEQLEKYIQDLWPVDLRAFWLRGVQSTPFTLDVLGTGAETAAAGAVAGAAGGAIGAGPLAPVAAAFGGGAGAATGFSIGSFYGAFKPSMGLLYADLRDNGINHNDALVGSAIGGLAIAAIEKMQFSGLTKQAKKGLIDATVSVAGQKKMLESFKEILTETGMQGVEEAAQKAVELATESLLLIKNGRFSEVKNMSQWLEAMWKEFVAGAQGGAGQIGTMRATGTALGSVKAAGDFLTVGSSLKNIDMESVFNKLATEMEVKGEIIKPRSAQDVIGLVREGGPQATATTSTAQSVAEAEDERKEAEFQVSEIQNERSEFEIQNPEAEVPAELNARLKAARQKLRAATERKVILQNEEVLASLKERIANTNLDKQQKAELEAEARKVEDTLRQIQADIAEREIRAEITKIDREVEQIDNAINERAEGGVRNKSALEKDLERKEELAQQKQDLEMTLDLKDQLLDPESLKELNIAIPNKSASRLAKLASRLVFKAAKTAAKNTKSSIKKIQKAIEAYIRTSGLTQANQAKLPAISSFQTREDLENRLEKLETRVNQLLEAQARKEALNKLQKQIDRTAPTTDETGKHLVSKFDPKSAMQKVLDLFAYYVGDNTRQDRYNELLEALERNPSSTELRIEKEVADLVGDLSSKSAAEIADLAERLKHAIDIGKAERLSQLAEQFEETQRLVGDAVTALQGDREGLQADISNPAADNSRFRNRFLRAFGKSISSWNGMLRILFQDSENVELFVRKLGVAATVEAERTAKRESVERMYELLEKHTGKKKSEILKLIGKGASDDPRDVILVSTQKGNALLTINQAVQVYMQMKDETLHAGLTDTETGNGYTLKDSQSHDGTSTQEQIETALDEADSAYRKLGDGLMAFYQERFDEINKAYKDEFGLELGYNEFYSGMAYRDLFTGTVTDAFSVDLFEMRSPSISKTARKPKTLIARTNNKLALATKDAFINALQQSDQMSHWLVWRKRKDLKAVFTDPTVQKVISIKYGQDAFDSVEMYLNDMTEGQVIKYAAWLESFLNKFMRTSAYALLGLKPFQFFKQMTSYINLMVELPQDALIEGAIEFTKDPEAAIKLISQADWFKTRYADFIGTTAGSVSSGQLSQLEISRLRDASLVFLKTGDKVVSLVGAYSAYLHYAKTMSHSESLAKAGQLINRTQSTGSIDEVSNLARGPFKVVTPFLQQPTRMFEYQLAAWRKFANFRTWDNFVEAVNITMVTHMAQALFVAVDAAWILATSDDDDEKEQAVWTVFLEFITGPTFATLGDAIRFATTSFVNKLFDKKFPTYDFQALPFQTANNAGRLWLEALRPLEDKPLRPYTLLYDYMQSINRVKGGIPEYPFKILKQYAEGKQKAQAGAYYQ